MNQKRRPNRLHLLPKCFQKLRWATWGSDLEWVDHLQGRLLMYSPGNQVRKLGMWTCLIRADGTPTRPLLWRHLQICLLLLHPWPCQQTYSFLLQHQMCSSQWREVFQTATQNTFSPTQQFHRCSIQIFCPRVQRALSQERFLQIYLPREFQPQGA